MILYIISLNEKRPETLLSRSLDTTIIAQVKLSFAIIFCGGTKKFKKICKKVLTKDIQPLYNADVLKGNRQQKQGGKQNEKGICQKGNARADR